MRDPAFLFYSDHFLMGCADLTFEERGQYITMLCVHHQKGFLTRKSIGLCLGIPWESLSEDLRKKFDENTPDVITNERLLIEMERRAKFSKKQSENGKKGGRPPKIKVSEKSNLVDEVQKSEEIKTQKKPNPKPKKKPLVNVTVNVNEEEKEKGVKGEKTEEEQLIEKYFNPDLKMPAEFIPLWAEWIEYKRKKKKNFKYADTKYEQMAVDKLLKYSGGDVEIAKIILQESFSKSYEGFFELKPDEIKKIKTNNKNDSDDRLQTNR